MISSLFARLSTGLKMLLILSAALLPLGLIAVFASIESARTSRLTREADVRILAVEGERRLSGAIADLAVALRSGTAAGVPDRTTCMRMLGDMADARPYPVSLGLFERGGRRLCATAGLSASPVGRPASGIGTEVRLLARQSVLRFSLGDLPGGLIAVGELPRAALARLAVPAGVNAGYGERLREGDAVIDITAQKATAAPLGQTVAVSVPVSNGQLSLELRSPPTPMRVIEMLMILLPVLMWLAAALIGWLVMDRLVLAPLAQLQRAIADYHGNGGVSLQLPALTTPSIEIRELADAFAQVTGTISAHEAELESGLVRQTKLTREVHHRVKNNLQVVSSLINLHSRGVTVPEVGAAYAAIQRRVDALAVVHRNHYAELEENRGVGLRALLGELATSLRSTAAPEGAALTITLDLLPAHLSQDVAVPVAFLVTELVEMAMECDAGSTIAIVAASTARADRAILSLTAPGLTSRACRDHPAFTRCQRVVEGLSRQLRAPLVRDEATGRHSVEIGIIPPVGAATL